MPRKAGDCNKRFTFSVHAELQRRGVNIVGRIWEEIQTMEHAEDRCKYMLQLLEYVDSKRKCVEVTVSPEAEAEFESIPVSLLTQYVQNKRANEDQGGEVQVLS